MVHTMSQIQYSELGSRRIDGTAAEGRGAKPGTAEHQFSGLITEHATEVGPGRMAGYSAEQRSIRASRISRISLLAVVVAAFAAVVVCRDEVQFVVDDIAAKSQTSPAYAAAERKAKLRILDLQKPAVGQTAVASNK
jgi:hypothetical protein